MKKTIIITAITTILVMSGMTHIAFKYAHSTFNSDHIYDEKGKLLSYRVNHIKVTTSDGILLGVIMTILIMVPISVIIYTICDYNSGRKR